MRKKHKNPKYSLERHTLRKGRTEKENDREQFTLSLMVERKIWKDSQAFVNIRPPYRPPVWSLFFCTEGQHTPFLSKYCFCCLKDWNFDWCISTICSKKKQMFYQGSLFFSKTLRSRKKNAKEGRWVPLPINNASDKLPIHSLTFFFFLICGLFQTFTNIFGFGSRN